MIISWSEQGLQHQDCNKPDSLANCEGLHRIYDKTKSDIFHFSDAGCVVKRSSGIAEIGKLSVFHDFENICCSVQGCACFEMLNNDNILQLINWF